MSILLECLSSNASFQLPSCQYVIDCVTSVLKAFSSSSLGSGVVVGIVVNISISVCLFVVNTCGKPILLFLNQYVYMWNLVF